MRLAARLPNHLGDCVMALPAIEALARTARVALYGPERFAGLFAHVGRVRAPRRIEADVAVLFAPSLRAAWEARRVPRVVGTATDHRRWLLTDVVGEAGHRSKTYRRLAAAVGAEVGHDGPRLPFVGEAADVPDGHVALVAVAAGGANREWQGFRDLADLLARPVVFHAGPGEEARVRALAGAHAVCTGLSVVDLAATLRTAALVVANDTGPAHLARAVGVPTVVVHTSTTGSRTGPAGAVAVEGPDLPCRPCYRNTCREDLACLDVPVETVLAAVRASLP